MAVVLDNTKGTSLGMAMVQHSMDNLVKQRMQMNDLYADANKAIAVTQYTQAAETERAFINASMTPPEALTIEKQQAKNFIDDSRKMTANSNKTIQDSNAEFQRFHNIDSWDNTRNRNMVDTTPGALGKIGNAITQVGAAATNLYGNIMGKPAAGTADPNAAPDPGVSTAAPDVTVAPDPNAVATPDPGISTAAPNTTTSPDPNAVATPDPAATSAPLLMQSPTEPNKMMFNPFSQWQNKGVSK